MSYFQVGGKGFEPLQTDPESPSDISIASKLGLLPLYTAVITRENSPYRGLLFEEANNYCISTEIQQAQD